MATITYQVNVKDRNGLVVARFAGGGRRAGGGLQSISYHRRLRTEGAGTLVISGEDARVADHLLLGTDDAHLDYILEIWRRDPAGGLDWYRDFTAFHRGESDVQDEGGQLTYTSYGEGLNVLLASEDIRYTAGSAQASKAAAAETAAKEFVDENIGPGAGVDGLGNTRVRSGLTVEADAASGAVWTGARANDNLLDVLVEIADFAEADFNIVNTTTADWQAVAAGPFAMEFRWRTTRWGQDRTVGNAAGNAPVEFSAAKRTATNIRSVYSHANEANVIDVLGQGVGAVRAITTRNTTLATLTAWSRRAVARQANTESALAGRESVGDGELEARRAKRAITFTTVQTPGLRYGPASAIVPGGPNLWDLGDLVTVRDQRGISYNVKIVGVRVTMGADGHEQIQPECEAER